MLSSSSWCYGLRDQETHPVVVIIRVVFGLVLGFWLTTGSVDGRVGNQSRRWYRRSKHRLSDTCRSQKVLLISLDIMSTVPANKRRLSGLSASCYKSPQAQQ